MDTKHEAVQKFAASRRRMLNASLTRAEEGLAPLAQLAGVGHEMPLSPAAVDMSLAWNDLSIPDPRRDAQRAAADARPATNDTGPTPPPVPVLSPLAVLARAAFEPLDFLALKYVADRWRLFHVRRTLLPVPGARAYPDTELTSASLAIKVLAAHSMNAFVQGFLNQVQQALNVIEPSITATADATTMLQDAWESIMGHLPDEVFTDPSRGAS